ncbi:MAG TPA: ABC transporter substrate-binding protein [Actinocatenispora sp.]
MKRRMVGLGAALAVVLAAAGCGSMSMTASSPRRIVIGADLSLSGPQSDVGAVLRDALKLEASRLNKRHAIPGAQIVLSVRDNRSDPVTSADNIKQFQRDSDLAAAVTGPCDDCLARTAPLIHAGQLPVVSLSAANLPAGTAGSGSPLFKLAPNAADDAATLVELLVARHVKHAAVIADNDAYDTAAVAALQRAASVRGVELDAPVSSAGSVSDLARQALSGGDDGQFTDTTPDAVVVASQADRASAVVAALRKEKYPKTVVLGAVAAGPLFLPDRRLSGCYLVFPPILAMDDQVASTPEKAAQKQWFDDYSTAYGQYSAMSGFAADAMQALATAIGTVGTDQTKLAGAIETTQFDGMSGPVRYTPDDHSGLTPQGLEVLQADFSRWHLAG